ncbi:MAG: B12-binding domain-containing radical SAM protein [Lachnospiraceae bacterium]|nr:B12-binding domain-containing radical SAM protein [Lachnospiraceae bacterium]
MESRPCLLVGINAKYIHLNPAIYSLKYSLSEELQQSVEIVEYTINHVYEQILMDIFRRDPGMIGISCYIWNMDVVRRLCRDLAKILPNVPIWLGGPEAAWSGEELFYELPEITGVMFGEGEVVFPKLLAAWRAGTTLDEVPGLRFQRQEENCASDVGRFAGLTVPRTFDIVTTAEPAFADMDMLPFLYDKEIDFDHRIIYYESSRGCPFRCSYCLSAIEKTMRYRSLDRVLTELQWFLDRKVPQVKFLDRTFNSNRDRTLAVWQYILEHDNGVTNFHFEVTADLMSQAETDLLKKMRPGLVQLEIGVQSTNPETLAAISRRTDLDQLRRVTETVREGRNVHQHLDLIAGLPYEDIGSFSRSFDDVYRMRPSQLQLGFLKVLKGSPIAAQTAEFGLVYRDTVPYEILSTQWLSYRDVVRLKGIEEMVETYYNSHQFELTVTALERMYVSPFALYDALADFAFAENPEHKSLSRGGRFEQLKRFIHKNFGNCAEAFDTLLTMDYYLRDNARNRPSFAVGTEIPRSEYGKDIHAEEIMFDLEQFLQTGEVVDSRERWLFDYANRSAISGNARLRKENIPL